ncbi:MULTISPECIES: copper transporter [Nonomuraea]|uniref:copper transporter n=1 Tax=Nonomuraea TaxID=83681 RepID=UPI001C5F909A|nr:copper transporter [Nonomuraea ceibae]
MIDFRYHLVSIVAIFLALAVGIVMGTTLLQDPAIRSAEELTRQLTADKQEQRGQIDDLRSREQAGDAFVTTLTPKLVAGELTGEEVLLVEAPGAGAAQREATQEVLTDAGATITGRLSLTEKFFDPKSGGVLDGLAGQLKPAEMTFPTPATAYDKAATLLAATVTTTDPAVAGTPNAATASVLGGLETGGFVNLDGDPAKRATLVVMFAPDVPYEGENAETQAAAFVALASGLDAGGRGLVVAGTVPATGPGGAVTAVRDSTEVAKRVSTVDSADIPAGRVVIVYALREQLAGAAGQYGIGTGITAFQPVVPSPAPTTPQPTPSSSDSGS